MICTAHVASTASRLDVVVLAYAVIQTASGRAFAAATVERATQLTRIITVLTSFSVSAQLLAGFGVQ